MPLKIVSGLLVGEKFVRANDLGGKLQPELGIVHWTGGTTLAGAQRTLTLADSEYVSAHVLIDRDGARVQTVPFTRIAWHAGKSFWKGHSSLNTRAIGIELVNPGWKRPGFPQDWPTEQHGDKHYYTYPDAQLRSLVEVIVAITEAYGRFEWVGHCDVSPGRKPDPGPAFPWERVLSACVPVKVASA